MDKDLELKLLGGIPREVWDSVEAQMERQCPDILERYSAGWSLNLDTGEVTRLP